MKNLISILVIFSMANCGADHSGSEAQSQDDNSTVKLESQRGNITPLPAAVPSVSVNQEFCLSTHASLTELINDPQFIQMLLILAKNEEAQEKIKIEQAIRSNSLLCSGINLQKKG